MKRSSLRDQNLAFARSALTLRSHVGYTQAELADFLGLSRRAVVGWESGASDPKPEHLRKFIELAAARGAFPGGREAEAIRALWQSAHQKVLIDDAWLASLVADLRAFPELAPPTRASTESPPARPLPRGLPFQPTPFLGRRPELDEIDRLLADSNCRLLTLIGPGGVGKTRLGVEVASRQAGRFADGAAFVALAPVSTPGQIVSAIGDALNLSFAGQANPTAHLLDALRGRSLLLLLDNFEHLLDGADLVGDLLLAAPGVTILVTSRERLNLQAEWLFDVQGLAYPAEHEFRALAERELAGLADYSAVQLFVQRATQVQPGFPVTESTLTTIVPICRHVAGMPLAIELAAAGVRLMPVAEIERQIRSSLDVLATTLRDMPARHRSMRAVFDHSWNLLSEPERALFSRLSVFRGGCTAAVAAEIAGATLSGLSALVDKSLLRQNSAQTRAVVRHAPDEVRFSLLEPLREYALEKLAARGELETFRRKHAASYLALALAATAAWDTAAGMVEQLDREYDNARAALQWARDGGDLVVGFQLATALRKFWQRHGYYSEGRVWLEDFLARPDVDPNDTSALRARMQALHTAAWLASDQHDYARAALLFEQTRALRRALGEGESGLLGPEARQARAAGNYTLATELFEDALAHYRTLGDRGSLSTGGLGNSLYELALVLREQGQFDRSRALFEECLQLHRELGDQEGIAVGLMGLSDIARDQGDAATTRFYSEQSFALGRDLGLQWVIGFSLNNLALAAIMQGEWAQAFDLSSESVALFRGIQARGALAEILLTYGSVLQAQGRIGSAYDAFREALETAQDIGPHLLIATGLETLAGLMAQTGQAASAVQMLGAASALRLRSGTPLRPVEQPARDRALTGSRAALDRSAFDALWVDAQVAPLDQFLDLSRPPGD